MTLGSAIKKRREELGLTQEQLGGEIGVSGMTVYRWEIDESIPQRRLWPELERVLKKPISKLMAFAMHQERA